jgi:hypothetical protein
MTSQALSVLPIFLLYMHAFKVNSDIAVPQTRKIITPSAIQLGVSRQFSMPPNRSPVPRQRAAAAT